jgi:hypothetical protein
VDGFKRRLLYLETGGFLLLAKLMIQVMPMKRWLHFLGEKGLAIDESSHRPELEEELLRIRVAMYQVIRYLPGGKGRFSCLVQVLATAWSLRWRKIPFSASIAIQFQPSLAANKALAAHAWLSSGGKIIIQTTEAWSESDKIARFGWAGK